MAIKQLKTNLSGLDGAIGLLPVPNGDECLDTWGPGRHKRALNVMNQFGWRLDTVPMDLRRDKNRLGPQFLYGSDRLRCPLSIS